MYNHPLDNNDNGGNLCFFHLLSCPSPLLFSFSFLALCLGLSNRRSFVDQSVQGLCEHAPWSTHGPLQDGEEYEQLGHYIAEQDKVSVLAWLWNQYQMPPLLSHPSYVKNMHVLRHITVWHRGLFALVTLRTFLQVIYTPPSPEKLYNWFTLLSESEDSVQSTCCTKISSWIVKKLSKTIKFSFHSISFTLILPRVFTRQR